MVTVVSYRMEKLAVWQNIASIATVTIMIQELEYDTDVTPENRNLKAVRSKPSVESTNMGAKSKINIETRRSTTLKQRVILVQGPC
jgi:hypothetical protein